MVKGRLVVVLLLLTLLATDWLVLSAPISSFGGLSHLTGTARKIRLYVKNKFLQILPDATVNGTTEETQYSILQRSSVSVGQVKIQGVATCMFLCMDAAGTLYATKEFSESCVFNEMLEQHHYMTYSSTKHSNEKRTLYLALNKFGAPRKTQLKTGTPLGKLSSYTQTLTQPVAAEEVEQLIRNMIRASPDHHGLRHHQLCPPSSVQQQLQQVSRSQLEQPSSPPTPPESESRNKKKKKKKRKRRKCKEGEQEEEDGCTNRLEERKKCDERDEKCVEKAKTKKQKTEELNVRRKSLLEHLHTVPMPSHRRPSEPPVPTTEQDPEDAPTTGVSGIEPETPATRDE
nr:PREDICTED: fibroblast growth factor 3 [Bemisia tabaci]